MSKRTQSNYPSLWHTYAFRLTCKTFHSVTQTVGILEKAGAQGNRTRSRTTAAVVEGLVPPTRDGVRDRRSEVPPPLTLPPATWSKWISSLWGNDEANEDVNRSIQLQVDGSGWSRARSFWPTDRSLYKTTKLLQTSLSSAPDSLFELRITQKHSFKLHFLYVFPPSPGKCYKKHFHRSGTFIVSTVEALAPM